MKCTVEERLEKVLVGFKRRFHGVPYGRERLEQENDFYSSTRGKQWLLIGASGENTTDYAVVTNIDDEGYDFYIAYELDDWTREALFDSNVTGLGLSRKEFEVIRLPKRVCAVFPTELSIHPIADYTDIRSRIVTEWLPQSDYEFADAPEVIELHWRTVERGKRYIEITLPVIRKK